MKLAVLMLLAALAGGGLFIRPNWRLPTGGRVVSCPAFVMRADIHPKYVEAEIR